MLQQVTSNYCRGKIMLDYKGIIDKCIYACVHGPFALRQCLWGPCGPARGHGMEGDPLNELVYGEESTRSMTNKLHRPK